MGSAGINFPKTLLFTPTPPGQGSVGENYLRELVKVFPHDQLCCYSAWSTSYAVWVASPELDWLKMETTELPTERLVGKHRGPVLDHLHSLLRRPKYWHALDAILDEAVAFGKDNHIEVVFSVLASPSTIMMTRQLAERLQARLVCLIWDPPESVMKILNFDPSSAAKVMEEFEQVLKMADRIVVASQGMQEDYRLQYGKEKSNVLARPIDPVSRQPYKEPENSNQFVIGFSGSIYAESEFKALLWTLGELGWEINGKEAVLRVLGNSFNVPLYAAGKKARLEFLGHRPLPEAVNILSGCDLAYLPYWFDPRFSQSVRTCFPDKLVSYITAGVPILYHGPEDSSPTRFIERYPVGVCCHSLDTAAIAQSLHSAASNDGLRRTCYEAGARAIAEELNPSVFETRIRELLGVTAQTALRTEP